MISAESTRRGPGRLKYALPSIANTRPSLRARSERHCGMRSSAATSSFVRSSSKPHGETITASGSAAAIASHAKRRDFLTNQAMVDTPLALLGDDDLRPSEAVLKKIMETI